MTDEEKIIAGERVVDRMQMIHTPRCISIHKDELICQDWVHQLTPEDKIKGNVILVRIREK